MIYTLENDITMDLVLMHTKIQFQVLFANVVQFLFLIPEFYTLHVQFYDVHIQTLNFSYRLSGGKHALICNRDICSNKVL